MTDEQLTHYIGDRRAYTYEELLPLVNAKRGSRHGASYLRTLARREGIKPVIVANRTAYFTLDQWGLETESDAGAV